MMRIAIFTESYAPVINGVAACVRWLAAALRDNHQAVVYAPQYPGHVDDHADVVRLPSYRLPMHRDYPLAWPWYPGGYEAFARRRFDVVHTHSPFTLGQIGRRWARRGGIPVVTTYHTLYVEYAHYAAWIPHAPVRAWLRYLSRAHCDASDQVVVPTEPVSQVLRSYGVRRPISVIPTGLPPASAVSSVSPFCRDRLGVPAEASVVLYAGRLAREKNLALLIQAFGRVAAASPRAHLLVAGSGPCEAEARGMVSAAGLKNRVTFAGFVPPDRMPQCYAGAAVLAFTSLTDTQGLVIVEAKSAGLPVVSVNAYGPATVVRDGEDGFLVPNDPVPFAAAILRVLESEEMRATMASAALRDAERFQIKTTADRYLEIYDAARSQVGTATSTALQSGQAQG
jgi:1,2-diacylglycerol 3-alpha-glucosyltransferase